MQNRKSSIGRHVLESIQNKFADAPYKDMASEIKAYCLTALQAGGAAFFAQPTPDGRIYPQGHPDFIVSPHL